jgi:hypothetical protein
MRELGIFETVSDEVGDIIVAEVNEAFVRELVGAESPAFERLIAKG